jgi:hypothetical protein
MTAMLQHLAAGPKTELKSLIAAQLRRKGAEADDARASKYAVVAAERMSHVAVVEAQMPLTTL